MPDADALQTYIALMQEAKRRHLTINTIYNDPDRLVFKAIVIDHCYLQFRKMLELVAFSTLSANQHIITSLQGGKSRDYHADNVLRSIEKRFGSVYPRPIVQVLDPRPGVRADFIDPSEPFLDRADFTRLYNECGNILHGRSPFRKPIDLDFYWSRIPEWSSKIRVLLDSHVATIVKDPNLYLVQMGSNDEYPTISAFERQKS